MKKKVVFSLIVAWTIFPVLSVLLCSGIAKLIGVTVGENEIPHATILNIDIGYLLYTLGIMGWFAIITIPSGLLMLVIFSAFLLTRKIRDLNAKYENGKNT